MKISDVAILEPFRNCYSLRVGEDPIVAVLADMSYSFTMTYLLRLELTT